MEQNTNSDRVPAPYLDEELAGKGELKSFGGSDSDYFNQMVIAQTMQTPRLGAYDSQERQVLFAGLTRALRGIGPRDEIEGMLAAQMVGLHNAAMDCLSRGQSDFNAPE